MSWREDLGRVDFTTAGGPPRRLIGATFRGAPFFVATAEYTGGRRVVTHEYPFRDEPFSEDMGKKRRTFPVEGYVLGADYLFARDALITELEAGGVGELVHPYHGKRSVVVDTFRIRETSQDGGFAAFSIDFLETPAQPAQPTAVPDTLSAARSSVSAARAAVGDEFLALYNPGVYRTDIEATLRNAALAMDAAVDAVATETQDVARLKRDIAGLVSSAATLVNAPEMLLTSLSDVTSLLPGALGIVYSFSPGERQPATTVNRVQEQAMADVLQYLVQQQAAIRAAELALGTTYESYEAAVAAREEVTVMLDEQEEVAGDTAFPALVQLRADLVKAVPGAGEGLPHLVTYTPPLTVPSLVLAQRLYGDATREAEVVQRNSVANPCFVPGGAALEVLSDG